ncbi:MAG: DUF1343 domain-containing protein [Firmicutes bacterium]|nr:DUF1343 domain-containing protein [Bacillota bacterium]
MVVQPGVENFVNNLSYYIGTRQIGLITNPSAVNSNLESTLNLLTQTNQVRALFGLEHGIRGNVQAGDKVESYTDGQTGLPVYSLYGTTRELTFEMLQEVDCLVFDIQDVGCRYYTYLYSLLYILKGAKPFGLPIFVLDRPNPLGGQIVGGNLLEEEYISFVGGPIPIRYGLTIGELAHYFNEVYGIGAQLTVVPMEGWQRSYLWEHTGLSWVPPSPNIPTVDTVKVYPGMCLFEGTNVSEGRGTTRPFEIIGAPWIDGEELGRKMNGKNIPGVTFRAAYFTPMFSKYAGELCQGVQVHIRDETVFEPIQTALHLLEVLRTDYPEFSFVEPPHRRYFFDLLAGTAQLRTVLQEKESVTVILEKWEKEAEEFNAVRRQYLLY